MLAKLTFLQKEETALRDIESKITEQLTRLQQEELHLRGLLRESEDGEAFIEPTRLRYTAVQQQGSTEVPNVIPTLTTTMDASTSEPHPPISSFINTTPLEDLTLQPSALSVRTHIEEEEEEEEEEASGDEQQMERHHDDSAYNADLMALMQQIQGRTEPE